MKKIIMSAMLLSSSSLTFAVAPGGPDCGWGNLLFEGQSGFVPHFLASTTNGTSGNATFGMTSGTNGCSVNGTLTHSGQAIGSLTQVMDEFIADAAVGQGEAMTTVAVSMGIKPSDRQRFASTVHSNFDRIFSSSEMTAQEVYTNIVDIMKTDQKLSQYVG